MFNTHRLCIGTKSLLRQLWILSAGEKEGHIGISQDNCKNNNRNRFERAKNKIWALSTMPLMHILVSKSALVNFIQLFLAASEHLRTQCNFNYSGLVNLHSPSFFFFAYHRVGFEPHLFWKCHSVARGLNISLFFIIICFNSTLPQIEWQ